MNQVTMPVDDRRELRRALRSARRGLGAEEQRIAALAACRAFTAAGLLRPGARIAAYLPMDGELDPRPLIAAATRRGCRVYLPVIDDFRRRRMHFAMDGRTIAPRWLDLVIVPAVAIDPSGNRLGMGAGFYDRHFAFLAQRSHWRHPRLVALVHEFQLLPELPSHAWDVPVWGIVTPAGFQRSRPHEPQGV
ncbi:MAG: 5-formyltetrahydrofolate cyclo-ligase [Steroidobacteraceae bacterium]|nr:5-formyltetrahydrofolate cyclo-ligase [Steroidobacteraceae bacterium]